MSEAQKGKSAPFHSEGNQIATTIWGCARCGEDHEGITFHAFTFPPKEWKYWATCPTTGEPILMQITEPEAP